jgi:2-dehydropantoate 2-reductase
MKYLIMGAGGTGGSIAGFMTKAGFNVSVIARGKHLEAIQEKGLRLETTRLGTFSVFPKAYDMEAYDDVPDVIFNCVKGYSLDATIPFIRKVVHEKTVVIPILNLYGTGGVLQKALPNLLVCDGCIYIAAQIKEAGVICQTGDIFRVVFGVRELREHRDSLHEVARDLNTSGIRGILSENIKRDALLKFSFVSPMAACGAHYDVDAGGMQQEGEPRALFKKLIGEITLLAKAMGIAFEGDIVEKNLTILDALLPTASTSMQRDLKAGGESEMDGLLFEVVRLAQKYGVSLPTYTHVAQKLGCMPLHVKRL